MARAGLLSARRWNPDTFSARRQGRLLISASREPGVRRRRRRAGLPPRGSAPSRRRHHCRQPARRRRLAIKSDSAVFRAHSSGGRLLRSHLGSDLIHSQVSAASGGRAEARACSGIGPGEVTSAGREKKPNEWLIVAGIISGAKSSDTIYTNIGNRTAKNKIQRKRPQVDKFEFFFVILGVKLNG